ncbi:MAG: ubiquinone/menaquinone biosynthesis methyltransferase [Methanomethylophilus sp.]|nr:ubiquinone/menaquinone biosynthesis methyltransferase [Methanomethylophilus sp.]
MGNEDKIKPNGTQFKGKETYVKDVFTEISDYYDEMNEIMSMHMIQGWHEYMMKLAGPIAGRRCLDVGTGTGEIAFQVAQHAGPEGSVTGLDITPKMLDLARAKMKERSLPKLVEFVEGDALKMPYAADTFDLVTSGYMLRNVTDLQQAIDEMYRVLRPGGRAVVAEMATPDNRVVRYFYKWYIRNRVQKMGRKYDHGEKLDGKMPAYDWLVTSIQGFPHGKVMAAKFEKAGFVHVEVHSKTFGAVNIYVGDKP